MSNNITIELCKEDRARADRLIELLERRCAQAQTLLDERAIGESEDPVQKALAETISKATKAQESPENAPGATEAPTLTTTPQAEEKPKAEETAQPATAKTVDQKDIRALYVTLCSKNKKKEAQAIILPYATAITAIPDDKCQEVYDKLVALEG